MKAFLLALTFIIVCSCNTLLAQSEYFVSNQGNNNNAGDLQHPWKDINYALSHISSGDTLNVMVGVYSEKFEIPISNITLRNYNNDHAVIDASASGNSDPVIKISSKNNITVSGFEIRNNIGNDAQGILIEGSCENIIIENCDIHDIHFSSNPNAAVNENTNAQGIIVYGNNASAPVRNLIIRGNSLHDCRLGYSEGIAVNGNVDGFVVSGNTVYNLTNIGIVAIGHEGTCTDPALDQARNGYFSKNITHDCISPYATCGGLYIDGARDVIIENNVSYHNGFGIETGCENKGKTASNIIVRDNILYDNQICALAIGGYDYPSGSGKVVNSTFRNNSCYQNDYDNSGNGELYLSYSENTIIENNIFDLSAQNFLLYADLGQPGIQFNYNVVNSADKAQMTASWNGDEYTGYDAFVSGTGTNQNSKFASPKFRSPSIQNPDFHITADSPCVNAGNPSFTPPAAEKDMDNENRANQVVDCGADEYYTDTGIGVPAVITSVVVFPNPANEFLILKNIPQNTAFRIFSPDGKKVMEGVASSEIYLNISNLKPGMYFISFNNNILYSLKFIISR